MSKQTNDYIIQKLTPVGEPEEYWDGETFVEISQADIYKDVDVPRDELLKIKEIAFIRQLTDFEMGIFYDDL